jgi:hypothetical protein
MKRFVFLLAGLLLIASSLRAQTSVSGTITSPDGKPVAGASIIIEPSVPRPMPRVSIGSKSVHPKIFSSSTSSGTGRFANPSGSDP